VKKHQIWPGISRKSPLSSLLSPLPPLLPFPSVSFMAVSRIRVSAPSWEILVPEYERALVELITPAKNQSLPPLSLNAYQTVLKFWFRGFVLILAAIQFVWLRVLRTQTETREKCRKFLSSCNTFHPNHTVRVYVMSLFCNCLFLYFPTKQKAMQRG
jgi:hypothetical protein